MRSWIIYFALLPAWLGAGVFVPNYEQAVEQAQHEQKRVLLFFNGSDWSGLGMKMKREVLDTQTFAQRVSDVLVCYEVDFPEHSPVNFETLRLHKFLRERYHVDQLPALVLVEADQREIVRMGYFPATSEELAADLIELTSVDTQLHLKLGSLQHLSAKELRESYEMALQLQQLEVAQHILTVGVQSDDPAFFLLEQYRLLAQEGQRGSDLALRLRQQLFALDPNNCKGSLYHLALIDFQALSKERDSLKPEEIIKPLTDYLAQFGNQDSAHEWQIEMTIAEFFLDLDDWSVALQHAEGAERCAPAEKQQEIQGILTYIRDQANRVALLKD